VRLFRRIVLAAAAAGTLAGLLLSGLDFLGTVPLIRQAETYEEAATVVATGQAHEDPAWAPADGMERNAYTVLANLLVGIGFALLLCAIFAQRPALTVREGLFWGLAGFAVFVASPALGLPPEPPGVPAAPLGARQLWWLLAVGCTAAALYLLVLVRGAGFKALGVALLAFPHLLGAPQLAVVEAATPESLVHRFEVASVLGSAVFWSALGALGAWFYRRID